MSKKQNVEKKREVKSQNKVNDSKYSNIESERQARTQSRNAFKKLFDGDSSNRTQNQVDLKNVKDELKAGRKKTQVDESVQIDSSLIQSKNVLKKDYEEYDLLLESQNLQADFDKERTYGIGYEEFIGKGKFQDIYDRSKNQGLFLAYVKDLQFPIHKETTDQSEVSYIYSSSRESRKQILGKRPQQKKSAIFQEVRQSKKVAYPDIIVNLLNPKMTGELKRELAKKLSETVDADPKLSELVIQFSYKDLLDEVNLMSNPFELLNHLVKKEGLRIDEIMEALADHQQEIMDLGEADKRNLGLKFKEELVDKRFMLKQHLVQWRQLSDQQQNMILVILSFVKNELVISADQAPILAGYVNTLEKPEQKEDAFWQLFLKQKSAIKVIGLKAAFDLTGNKIAELVSENFNELFSWQIISSLKNYSLDNAKIEIFKSFVNIKRDQSKYTQVIKWLQDPSIYSIIKEFIKTQPSLNYDSIQESMNRVYDKIADTNFDKHLKTNIKLITNPTELNKMITSYFDSGVELRNDNAGKKIKQDLMKKLKEIEKKLHFSITDKEVFNSESVNKSLEHYTTETGITLYVWQRQIVQYAFYVSHVLNKNNIIQVPTGHGKTPIIAALAKALCDKENGKVVVVTMNTYLNHHALNKYTIPSTCKKFPTMPQNGQILYLSNSQLMSYNESKLDGAIIIYDEIDRCFQDQIASIQQDVKSKKYFLKFPPMILRRCKSVIGFTGTLSQSTLDQTAACQITEFFQISLQPIVDQVLNKIVEKKVYKTVEQRERLIVDTVRFHLKENKSVIVIDDQLKPDKQIAKFKDQKCQVFIFDNWGTGQFAPIDDRLSRLYQAVDPCIVHTNLHGVRGVDFKIDQKTHVILAFNPRNYYDIVQALGRGARMIGQSCEGTIIISQMEDKHQVAAANIMSYYQKIEAEEDTQESLRMGLLIVGHGKEMKVSQENTAKLVSIFKDRQSLYYQEDELDENAEANWQFIREVFPEGLVSSTPVEFMQAQNDLVTEQVHNTHVANFESTDLNVNNSSSFQ